MAQDHFKTPPDPKRVYKKSKHPKKVLKSMPNQPRSRTARVAARALATYSVPGCVGRGVRLGSEGSSVGGGGGVGGGGVWKFGVQKMEKIKFLKIQIRSAQNVGKVWISRKQKSSRPYLGPSEAIFSIDRKNQKKCQNFAYFPWWANGPYST